MSAYHMLVILSIRCMILIHPIFPRPFSKVPNWRLRELYSVRLSSNMKSAGKRSKFPLNVLDLQLVFVHKCLLLGGEIVKGMSGEYLEGTSTPEGALTLSKFSSLFLPLSPRGRGQGEGSLFPPFLTRQMPTMTNMTLITPQRHPLRPPIQNQKPNHLLGFFPVSVSSFFADF